MATTAIGAKTRSALDRLRSNAFANSTYAPAKSSGTTTSTATIRPGGLQDPNSSVQGGLGSTSIARTINPGSTAFVNKAPQTAGVGNVAPVSTANQQFSAAAAGGTGYNDAAQGGFSNPGDPWTGFAQRYMPAAADTLLSNPSQVFYDSLISRGMMQPGGDMGMISALEPYADIAPYIYALTNSNRQNFGSREAQVNFLNDFARNMTTPDGSDISIQGLNSAVFNNPYVQELYRTGNDPQNVTELNNMLSGNAALSFNPMLQKMVQALNDRRSYEYLSGRTQGQTGGEFSSYDQFLRSRGGPGSFYG